MAKVGPNAVNLAIAEMIGQLLTFTTHPNDHGHDNENHGDHDDDCGRGDSSAPTGRLGKAWNAKLQLRPFCAIQQFNTVAWTVFMINCYCKTMQCYHR